MPSFVANAIGRVTGQIVRKARAATFVCTTCSRRHPVTERSIHQTDMCCGCFDSAFALCTHCGANVNRTGYEANSCRHNGEWHCERCYYACHHYGNDSYWAATPLAVSFATYDEIGSTRKYGVEIETDNCSGHGEMKDKTAFGAKSDPTCRGREFDSPVLYGDEGLAEIRDLLAFGKEKDWDAGEGCGLHMHMDMRDESEESLARIMYAFRAAQEVFKSLVHSRRYYATYCSPPQYTCQDIRNAYEGNRDFTDFVMRGGRYVYVNTTAYSRHNTFENRMLEGTVDAELICNWVKINSRFADWAKGKTFEDLDGLTGKNGADILAAATGMGDWMDERKKTLAADNSHRPEDGNPRDNPNGNWRSSNGGCGDPNCSICNA